LPALRVRARGPASRADLRHRDPPRGARRPPRTALRAPAAFRAGELADRAAGPGLAHRGTDDLERALDQHLHPQVGCHPMSTPPATNRASPTGAGFVSTDGATE